MNKNSRAGRPSHKNGHLFAEYYERSQLPIEDDRRLEPKDIMAALDMGKDTYYTYRKKYLQVRTQEQPIQETQQSEAAQQAPQAMSYLDWFRWASEFLEQANNVCSDESGLPLKIRPWVSKLNKGIIPKTEKKLLTEHEQRLMYEKIMSVVQEVYSYYAMLKRVYNKQINVKEFKGDLK